MERREVIKKMALAFGSTVTAPVLLKILSSCNENSESWKPSFLNKREKYIIDFLVEIILPETNTIGGKMLNITNFIDRMMYKTVSEEEQHIFHLGSKEFINLFEKEFQKNVISGKRSDFELLLKEYFEISKNDKLVISKILELDFIDITEVNKEKYLIYKFLTTVRYYCLFGYYTSKTVMEDLLGYKPYTGYYNGCLDSSKIII